MKYQAEPSLEWWIFGKKKDKTPQEEKEDTGSLFLSEQGITDLLGAVKSMTSDQWTEFLNKTKCYFPKASDFRAYGLNGIVRYTFALNARLRPVFDKLDKYRWSGDKGQYIDYSTDPITIKDSGLKSAYEAAGRVGQQLLSSSECRLVAMYDRIERVKGKTLAELGYTKDDIANIVKNACLLCSEENSVLFYLAAEDDDDGWAHALYHVFDYYEDAEQLPCLQPAERAFRVVVDGSDRNRSDMIIHKLEDDFSRIIKKFARFNSIEYYDAYS